MSTLNSRAGQPGRDRILRGVIVERQQRFRRLIEIASIARDHSRWDLVERWTTAALSHVESRESEHLVQVSDLLTANYLRELRNTNDLAEALARAASAIEQIHEIDAHQIEAARHAITLRGGKSAGLVQVASWLRNSLGRSDLAIELAESAFQRDPKRASALTVAAAAHLDQGNITDAEDSLLRAEQLDPGSTHNTNLRARLNVSLGRPTHEIILEETAERSIPAHREFNYSVCEKLLQEQKFDSCLIAAEAMDQERSTIRTRHYIRESLKGLDRNPAA